MDQSLAMLVIDDTPDDWDWVVREIRREFPGIEMARIRSREDLAAALEQKPCDLVITEHRLLWGTGFEVLRQVKARLPQCPVVLCASSGNGELAARALEAGFEEYLVKNERHLACLPLLIRSALKRRRLHQDLWACQEEFLHFVQRAPIPLLVVEVPDRISFVNESFVGTFGFSLEEVPTLEAWWDKACPDPLYRRQVLALWSTMHEPGDPAATQRQKCHLVCRRGMVHTVLISRVRVGSKDLLMLDDVTQLTHADQKLLQLAAIVETSDDAIISKTLEGTITSWNRGAEKIYGYTKEEMVGRSVQVIIPPERRDELLHLMERVRRGEHVERLETERVKKDGTRIQMSLTISPIVDEEGRVVSVSAIGSDITYRKNLENQLRHSQKMEAVGTLSGGIAHDFNNILTAIIGHAALLTLKLPKGAPALSDVQQIQKAAGRAANLTKSLLAFSRKKAIETRAVELNGVIEGVEGLLKQLMREDIDLRSETCGDDLVVLADSGQIEQVLVNLATNARDALPEGGAIRIATATVELDREFVRTHGYGTPGRYAAIVISDNGTGMDEATRQRIFEPFFTTKEAGKGTGLGLSIVYGIIKQHGGHINCYSEPGKGTTFRIYLPLTGASPEADAPMPEQPPPGGDETILLVEDDAATRNMNRQLLENFGYRVVEAVDGEDAVAQFLKHREEIDLVFLDAIMPKRGGREAFQEISRAKPGVKVLFTSGYAADIYDKGEHAGPNFIAKPILPTILLKKLRQILDEGS